MKVEEYLKKVAYKDIDYLGPGSEETEVWKSTFDNSFMGIVGMENETIKALAERGITDELTHGVGFSPENGKWYGWSHRGLYGFKVGSTCKKGDCHYRAASLEDEIEAATRFWDDDHHINTRAEKVTDGVIQVSWEYDDKVPNESLRGTTGGSDWHYSPEFGRGEWTAKTMEDAKIMAQDFNEGIS